MGASDRLRDGCLRRVSACKPTPPLPSALPGPPLAAQSRTALHISMKGAHVMLMPASACPCHCLCRRRVWSGGGPSVRAAHSTGLFWVGPARRGRSLCGSAGVGCSEPCTPKCARGRVWPTRVRSGKRCEDRAGPPPRAG
ncbi:hypothetical protein BU14_0240s0006 [Porphyra umbilicalis]|uniref:Uncharacterized protein n=1 Tax=Porphyra umbilicalis TaxID=2786 RepID=A0A1X6P3B0_PORUM|nr:hypothetical protein BU14_0240s0006 [Porphyra umbilicalis]|eukprot:OSX75328.1 hypothetical protein BU14_0240s0006 [Porphyra umbilicalis]